MKTLSYGSLINNKDKKKWTDKSKYCFRHCGRAKVERAAISLRVSLVWRLEVYLRVLHMQIAVIHYYIAFTNFLTWYEFKLYFCDTFWTGQWFYQTWSRDFFWKCILVCKFSTVLLPNLLRPNFNSIDCVKVDISTRKLQTL